METNETPDAVETEAVETEAVVENTAGETENVAVETPKVKRKRITREKFMEVWEETVAGLEDGELEGSGVKIISTRLGIGVGSIQSRVSRYRKVFGIELSTMPRMGGGAKIPVETARDELAKIKAAIAAKRAAKAEAATANSEVDAEG